MGGQPDLPKVSWLQLWDLDLHTAAFPRFRNSSHASFLLETAAFQRMGGLSSGSFLDRCHLYKSWLLSFSGADLEALHPAGPPLPQQHLQVGRQLFRQ